jgi:hypothetical protein
LFSLVKVNASAEAEGAILDPLQFSDSFELAGTKTEKLKQNQQSIAKNLVIVFFTRQLLLPKARQISRFLIFNF